MLRLSVRPNRLTYPFVSKSVASLSLLSLGRGLHCLIVKSGVEYDAFVRVHLADMYVKLGKTRGAFKMFDETPERNKSESVLLWNVLINGCSKIGYLRKAVELFGVMPKKNAASWVSLIDGFMRKGDLKKVGELFEQMPEKGVVSWTAMINGFSQNGEAETALAMFFQMLDAGVRANDFTVVSALSACAKVGALEAGVRVHNYISCNDFGLKGAIGTALVHMYAKCGNIEAASLVFGETKEKDLLTWTAMIWGLAIHGRYEQAIQCFKKMMYSGIEPDGTVFLAILTACWYSGQVKLALNFFDSMSFDYFIEPSVKHYTVVVNLLSRVGQVDKALNFINKMPETPDFMIWGALFCACRTHKNTKIAKIALQQLLQLKPKHPSSYVLLSNIYAAEGRWKDVARVRTLMQRRSIKKDPGWSYIEVNGHVHRFEAGGHKLAKEIHSKLEDIMAGAREQGYMPGTEWVLRNIQEEKEEASGCHSEKLALAFGLIQTTPGTTIKIVKKLTICGDCHSLMKYASKISQREIVLRDTRFHYFKDGTCSCRDYW